MMAESRLILVVVFVAIIILSSTIVYILSLPYPNSPTFPMWVLGEDHAVSLQDLNVTVGSEYSLFVGAQNKMGTRQECAVTVKLRNVSMPLPSTSNATPSPLPSLLNFSFNLNPDEDWEEHFTFRIFGAGNLTERRFTTTSVEINSVPYNVTIDSRQTEGAAWFEYQFLFELWVFNTTVNDFRFSGVWVSSPFLRVTV
jgi:hypothetical protein